METGLSKSNLLAKFPNYWKTVKNVLKDFIVTNTTIEDCSGCISTVQLKLRLSISQQEITKLLQMFSKPHF
jgi:predicted DNA-binding helix-hairpin-helix protein